MKLFVIFGDQMDAIRRADRDQDHRHDVGNQRHFDIQPAHEADGADGCHDHVEQRKDDAAQTFKTEIEGQNDNDHHNRQQDFQIVTNNPADFHHLLGKAAIIQPVSCLRRAHDLFQLLCDAFFVGVRLEIAQHHAVFSVQRNKFPRIHAFIERISFQAGEFIGVLRDGIFIDQLADFEAVFGLGNVQNICEAHHAGNALNLFVRFSQLTDRRQRPCRENVIGFDDSQDESIAAVFLANAIEEINHRIMFQIT